MVLSFLDFLFVLIVTLSLLGGIFAAALSLVVVLQLVWNSFLFEKKTLAPVGILPDGLPSVRLLDVSLAA